MIERRRPLSRLIVIVATAAEAGAAEVPEPDGYRLENYRAPTPATLRGARVIGTDEAETIWRSHSASFIDVLPRPPRPQNLPEGTVVARQAAVRYSRQHLAARHRLWRTRAQHGRLFLQGAGEGDARRSRQNRLSYIVWRIAGCRGTQPSARSRSAIRMSPGIAKEPTAGRRRACRCKKPRRSRVPAE